MLGFLCRHLQHCCPSTRSSEAPWVLQVASSQQHRWSQRPITAAACWVRNGPCLGPVRALASGDVLLTGWSVSASQGSCCSSGGGGGGSGDGMLHDIAAQLSTAQRGLRKPSASPSIPISTAGAAQTVAPPDSPTLVSDDGPCRMAPGENRHTPASA